LNSSGATPKATLNAQMYTSTSFEKIGARPARFKVKENVAFAEQTTTTEIKPDIVVKYKERDLHEVFVQYVCQVTEPKIGLYSFELKKESLNLEI